MTSPLLSINGPVTGIGIPLGAGSWTVLEAARATTVRKLGRNIALIDEPARWQGIDAWKPRRITGNPFIDIPQWFREVAKLVDLPWHPDWTTPGGTQWQSADNGTIVVNPDGTRWEIQGMAQNLNGSWRCDGALYYRPGMTVVGSQLPWTKLDGLMRPSWLSGPWPGPVRLVGVNVQYGPGATAAKGARVEHPKVEQMPADYRKRWPSGNDPTMIPSGTLFRLRITDDQIEQWLDATGVPENTKLRTSKRWFAIGLRTHGMRLAETGTGHPILESSGGCNPAELAAWRDRGIVDERTANQLGADLFTFGDLEVAA